MTLDDIQLLYAYDRWANARVSGAVSVLSAEQFTQDLGGGFGSVRETLLHILGGEWIWLMYWKEPPATPDAVATLVARRDALFRSDKLADIAAIRRKWAELERDQAEFVNRLTNGSLEQMLPYRGTQIKLAHLMQHVMNHSTYHRGQLALMLRQLGAEPRATDFHVFLVEGLRETRR